MCLIVFSYKEHPKYPFIFAGNRDEFYSRPAKPAHFWDTNPRIVAGRDRKAGGTWLGVSEDGMVAALTNYRDLEHPRNSDRSRGELIPLFLTSKSQNEQRVQQLTDIGENYDGFNMIAGNIDNLFYLSNVKQSYEKIKPGLHGLSNAYLNTPWPKVEVAKSAFREAIQSGEPNKEEIFRLLQNRDVYPYHKLPDTGLSPEMEKAVSPVFIQTDDYGTRCSTLLLINKEGWVTFTERTYSTQDKSQEIEKRFHFQIE